MDRFFKAVPWGGDLKKQHVGCRLADKRDETSSTKLRRIMEQTPSKKHPEPPKGGSPVFR
jgi:hypothetical protein